MFGQVSLVSKLKLSILSKIITCTAVGNHIIGPVYLPQRQNSADYLDFLQNRLDVLLEDVPLALIRSIVFQHDGCPVHTSRIVKDFLNQQYGDQWIGRNGPIQWPPRSPDLSPLDYFIWGRAKELVYTEEILNIEQLKEKIDNAFQTMKTEIQLNVTTTEIRRRCEMCISVEGSHFEHLR